MKRRIAIVAAVVLAALLGGMFGKLWAQKEATLGQSLRLFSRVVGLVLSSYVEQVEPEELIKAAVNGMLESLDPHTNFLEKDDFSELRVRTEAQFGGIGIHIGMVDGRLTVIAPIEGTPAERAGVHAGDRIAEIEGKSTEGYDTEDAVRLLRGEPGTKVRLGLERLGLTELIPIEITRAIINIKAVPYAGMVTSDIGYVRLADFSKAATRELTKAVDSLLDIGAAKLILDLRSNGGGLLAEGRDVTDLFLPQGRVIVSTRGRVPDSRHEFSSETNEPYGEFPLVVLVDRGSASAAEIVAGAIQDWERGVILGDTTFGKGSVQTIHQLDAETAVKITTAYWYTPSGRCINRPRDKNGDLEADSASAEKTTFTTLGGLGRTVFGGGAIVPDIYLPYEELTVFGRRVTREAYFDFAVEYASSHPGLTMEFEADSAVLNGFRSFLREAKKLTFTDSEFDSSALFFTAQIEREVAGKLAGMRGEYKMRLRRDKQVARAVELLTGVDSNRKLLAELAGR